MRIDNPEWLILIPILVGIGIFMRDLRFEKPLRFACLALLVGLFVDPQWQLLKPGVDLMVLVDQSDSAQALLTEKETELEEILSAGKQQDDRLRYIDFAQSAVLRSGGETAVYQGNRNETRMDLALRYAIAQEDPERATRLLLVTDGYSTAPVHALSETLNSKGISVFHRLLNEDVQADVRLSRFEMPMRAQPGAPFLIEFMVEGTGNKDVTYQLYRNDQLIGDGEVELQGGQAWVRLVDRLNQPGASKYTVRVHAPNDTKDGNNVSERWIEMDAGSRILLISAYLDDPTKPVLEAQGFTVDLVNEYGGLNSGTLAGVQAVFINNVPANVLPDTFLKELSTYVTVQGGGFAMFGGKYSFGSGGYYRSAVDDVLPISMELREDQKRLATAMAIVMDRSGSMSATVGGGRTKMDLANAGASGTVELLGPMDSIAVFAVDSLAHEVVGMTLIGNRQDLLRNQILHIESTGGGIFVYTGLKAAWDQLKNVGVGQKHIILFSDAADSEEPGKYKQLLAEMREAGATVSVIGLGSEKDSDAEFLKDIAKRGAGRIFFNSNPTDLPRVFAQETVAVARSSFVEERTEVVGTDAWMQIAAKPLPWLSEVDGYNLAYLKQDAELAARTTDEFKAPLVAFKRFGAGRSAALTFPVSGEFSSSTRQWQQLPDLLMTLTRWLVGQPLPEGIGLNARVDGSLLKLDLLYDERHELLVFSQPPKILLTNDNSERAVEIPWRRIRPGYLSAETQIDSGKVYKGAVQLGEMTIPFGPINRTENIEWQQNSSRLNELASLSTNTGGKHLVHLNDIWKAERSERYMSLRIWLLLALLPLCLFEFLRTRMA